MSTSPDPFLGGVKDSIDALQKSGQGRHRWSSARYLRIAAREKEERWARIGLEAVEMLSWGVPGSIVGGEKGLRQKPGVSGCEKVTKLCKGERSHLLTCREVMERCKKSNFALNRELHN